jgi:hypothetical protein
MPLAIASWRNSATDQQASGSPRRDGSSQANALIATTTLGGKAGWSPAAWLFFETRESLAIETLSPLADNPARRVETGSNAVVLEALAGKKHDLGSDNVAVR